MSGLVASAARRSAPTAATRPASRRRAGPHGAGRADPTYVVAHVEDRVELPARRSDAQWAGHDPLAQPRDQAAGPLHLLAHRGDTRRAAEGGDGHDVGPQDRVSFERPEQRVDIAQASLDAHRIGHVTIMPVPDACRFRRTAGSDEPEPAAEKGLRR